MKQDATNRKEENVIEKKKKKGCNKLSERHRSESNGSQEYYARATHPKEKEIRQIAKVFGAEVMFVTPLTEDADKFNGVYLDGVIVISVGKDPSKDNPANVVFTTASSSD